jgi:hypothetical protein
MHIGRYDLLIVPGGKFTYYWHIGVNLPHHDLTLIIDSNLKRSTLIRLSDLLLQVARFSR